MVQRQRPRRAPRRRRPVRGFPAPLARAVFDTLWGAGLGVGVLDDRLRCRRGNAALAALAGLPAEALRGRRITDLLPDLPDQVRGDLADALGRGEARIHRPALVRLDSGEERHWQTSVYPLRRTRGGVSGVVLFVREVTALRRQVEAERQGRAAAEAAAERLARLQAATAALSAAATPAQVAETALEQGRRLLAAAGGMLWWSDDGRTLRLRDTFGYSEDALRAWAELRPEAAMPALDAFRSRRSVWVESPDELAVRYPALAASPLCAGHGAWVSAPVVLDERPLGALCLSLAQARRFAPDERALVEALAQACARALERATLYEEQARLRAAAEENAARLDALFAAAPVGLALLDREMRYLRVNPALARINGTPPEQHLGRTPWDVLPRMPRDELLRDLRRVGETAVPLADREISGETPAAPGLRRTWLRTIYPVHAAGHVFGLGVLLREVTEQREAEEFGRQLLGIVGHDLRSPLLAISSSAAMLQGGLGEREERALARILSSAERMAGIVRALADYTLLKTGQGIPLDRRPADLGAICRAVIDEAAAGGPGERVRCDAAGDLRGEWDPDRVGQVMSNLLGNAVAHGSEAGPVEVICRGDEDAVTAQVRNEGPPIPHDLLAHVFEPFRRGAPARAGRRGGLGLGLFIARQIVLAHGGSIEASSGGPEGTVFSVRLPRRPPAAG